MSTQRATTRTIRELFPRGTRIVCEVGEDGPFTAFEARIAASQDHILHMNLLDGLTADRIAKVGGTIRLYRDTSAGRYTSVAMRIENAVPGGLTVKVTGVPEKFERRQYLRVRCDVPLRWRVVTGTEADTRSVQILRSREISEADKLRDSLEGDDLGGAIIAILERLDRIELKVDDLLRGDVTRADNVLDSVVDLSGSGMRFVTDQTLVAGQLVDATLYFEKAHPNSVAVLAKVVRVDPPNLGRATTAVACRFITIHATDREHVIRHTFRFQREALRRAVT